MSRRPTAAPPTPAGNRNGLLWLLGIIGILVVLANISKCSSSTTTRTAADLATSDPTIKGLNSAIAAQTKPPMKALDSAGVRTGFADMSASMAAEGLSGAMIYSQNCYEALSRTFSWRLLDVCGAADVKAVAAVPEDEVADLSKEITYFHSEVAAARYLGAATGGGTTTENADARFAKIQARLPTSKAAVDNFGAVDNASIPAPAMEGEANAENMAEGIAETI